MIFDRNELLESKNLIVVWWFTEPLIKSNDFTCRFGIFDRLRKFRRKFLTKKKTTNMNRTEVGASETCNHLFYKLQDSPETRLVWELFYPFIRWFSLIFHLCSFRSYLSTIHDLFSLSLVETFSLDVVYMISFENPCQVSYRLYLKQSEFESNRWGTNVNSVDIRLQSSWKIW